MEEPTTSDRDRAGDIRRRISALKQRWPAHSAPPNMWRELEEMEEELQRIEEAGSGRPGGRQAGSDPAEKV